MTKEVFHLRKSGCNVVVELCGDITLCQDHGLEGFNEDWQTVFIRQDDFLDLIKILREPIGEPAAEKEIIADLLEELEYIAGDNWDFPPVDSDVADIYHTNCSFMQSVAKRAIAKAKSSGGEDVFWSHDGLDKDLPDGESS